MKRPRTPLARVLEELKEYSCHELTADQDSRDGFPEARPLLAALPIHAKRALVLRSDELLSKERSGQEWTLPGEEVTLPSRARSSAAG